MDLFSFYYCFVLFSSLLCVLKELVLLRHHLHTCWISCSAGQSEWNTHFISSHQRHKGVFVTREQGHLFFPLANKRSHSPPFL